MKKIIVNLIFFLLPLQNVHAHPVDDLCDNTGQFIFETKMCQPSLSYACFKNPILFSRWKAYWHHRRTFVHRIHEYWECLGEAKQKNRLNQFTVDYTLKNYWDVVPAVQVENLCHYYRSNCKGDTNCKGWMLDRLDAAVESARVGAEVWAPREIKVCKDALK